MTARFSFRLFFFAALATGGRAEFSPPDDGLAPVALEAMTVTGTRERAPLSRTPQSIGLLSTQAIQDTAPLHPAQLLGQIPGVGVAVTNGEGHTTAIRQPFTTSPVYLFLEDGIPVRATGFFNHNALYEVDMAMAGSVEVTRGPGTALYGSDAIGGIVNVLTRAPQSETHVTARAEAGSFGTWRLLAEAGSALGDAGAYAVRLNRTHVGGWRDTTAYDRQGIQLRADYPLGADSTLKAIVAVSQIDQETGANSPLTWSDFRDHPTRNLFPIAYREVSAVRASVEYERLGPESMVSVIPYFRKNAMELNGSYNLSFDPRIEETENASYGLLAKWRLNLPWRGARLISGLDVDYSPGSRREDNLLVSRSGSGANTLYHDATRGARIYDYRVTFSSVSPYVHTEFAWTDRLRFNLGVRHDDLRFRQRNRLPAGAIPAVIGNGTRYYGQLEQNQTRFTRVSPKLGATYSLTPHAHLFAAWHSGFRAPSESQLYRAGHESTPELALARARLALELQPIKAQQFEAGVRGEYGKLTYELVGYELVKRDDLVSQRDLATNVSRNVNAGETRHRGIEVGLGAKLGAGVKLDASFSYARHRYVDWTSGGVDYSGHTIEAAPEIMANTRLSWRPNARTWLQLEWVHLGSYWLEPGNSDTYGRYPGHDLFHVRASYALTSRLTCFARVLNLTDRRYAESASVSSSTPVFSPGLPRALYAGLEYAW